MDASRMLRGIDFNPSIGGWQDNVSIETLETVVEFAWGKVSEGWGWRVPAENTMRRVEVAIRRGFPMGVYHFGWGGHSQRDQVRNFLTAIGSNSIARRIGLCLDSSGSPWPSPPTGVPGASCAPARTPSGR